ncbi:hypothetical protein PR202_ga16984 [Eleusine coracana subsp. coracana]|uniref:Uncharacterized protein n=1 Tax=Eleusine coracana subsp. coracana TaxID=191504 RepID=A0AAV5CPP5_ELECO|nr:hypothetical protein PR202_ga16984 [Eleusine coracana subsp. coracana]
MSCFRLLGGLCKHIEGLLRNFWWGCKDRQRKPCWVTWDDTMRPKFCGGMGFRDIELFNLALLAKQAWRITRDESSLSARILKPVYYSNGDFLHASLGSRPLKVWHAILDGKEVLTKGLARVRPQTYGPLTGCLERA